MSKHHEHEISDHPEVKWALELLKPDPLYHGGLKEYASEIICISLGIVGVASNNYFSGSPLYSGVHRYGIGIVIGYGISQIANKIVNNHKALRDTKLRDYIIRNPDLFPEPERVKYKELLQPWLPVR